MDKDFIGEWGIEAGERCAAAAISAALVYLWCSYRLSWCVAYVREGAMPMSSENSNQDITVITDEQGLLFLGDQMAITSFFR